MIDHRPLLDEAVRIAGTQAKLASAIGMTQQGVSYYMTRAKRIPAEVAIEIDRFTSGKVSKEALRPDIFGRAA